MSVTCGFFNSSSGDREYDAEQISSIFDGLIRDGVFATIGTAFNVTASSGLIVNVGIGKAWFNHTWTVNDSVLPLTAPESDALLDRIDAVVLEVNSTPSVRANTIKFISGTAASTPTNPIMTNEEKVHQYPLCYIYRKSASTVIAQADITPMIGSESTPFVTGILDVISMETLLGKWQNELDTWTENEKAVFTAWFNEIKGQLEGDVAANLQNQIINIQSQITDIKVSTANTYPVSGTALANNTIYRGENVLNTYAFTAPVSGGWAHGFFVAGASPAITFKSGTITGKLPTFKAGKKYEFDVYDSVWVVQEVTNI